jgi:hypothetical protein
LKDFDCQFKKILGSLASHKRLIEENAKEEELKAAKLARELAEKHFLAQRKVQREQQWRAVIEWLSPANPKLDQEECMEITALYPRTGTWLYEDKRYKSWLALNGCPIFWLSGIPGAGM